MSHILIPTGGFPPDIGGPATYVPHIAAALATYGHRVTVVTMTPANNHKDDSYSFQVVRLPFFGSRIRRWVTAVTSLFHLMKTADLLYVNGLLMETAVASLFRLRPMATKVVGDIVWERAQDKGWVSDSIDTFQHTSYRWPIELRRTVRNWAMQRMEHVIVPSQYLQEIVTGWGIGADQITVIYNAYQPPLDVIDEMVAPLDTPFNLITVCRLVRWKQVDALINLLPALPDVGLLIVGDGPERERLELLTQVLEVAHRVCFMGNVPRMTVIAALKSADLFVLYSTYEGLPHVLLEALAANLPIVAAQVGGMAEVIEDGVNGRLIPPHNPAQLLATITELMQNYSQYQITIPPQFWHETMIKNTIDLFTQAGWLNGNADDA